MVKPVALEISPSMRGTSGPAPGDELFGREVNTTTRQSAASTCSGKSDDNSMQHHHHHYRSGAGDDHAASGANTGNRHIPMPSPVALDISPSMRGASGPAPGDEMFGKHVNTTNRYSIITGKHDERDSAAIIDADNHEGQGSMPAPVALNINFSSFSYV